MMERRRALAWLAPAGGAAIAASTAVAAAAQMSRGGKGGGATRSGVITVGGGGRPGTTGGTSGGSSGGPSTGTTTTTITTTSSSSGCVADASETNVPYPADGTNTSSGSTSNVLTTSGIVRTDIRPSFVSSTTTAQGVAMTITLTLVNVNSSCAPLAGYAVYIWQCDAAGPYSLYTAPKESYLRGVGVTDANDEVTFTTIFPGCYSGRWPHIHFEVYSSLSTATGARYASLIGQVAMPSAVCSTVYSGSSLYSSSVSNFRSVRLSSDNVFGDNTSAQLAQQTPTMSGSVSGGYAAAAKIGLAL
ncbi:intradiol ring-cleavage dioxygenase [Sphingomonas gellani]|nr:intradiol ring-cleavage dioxygenase [Sphingomonas gellani]